MKTLEEVMELCYNFQDYPEIIEDTIGMDANLEGYIPVFGWINQNRPRNIRVELTTFRGTSAWGAMHYYVSVEAEGISFSKEDEPKYTVFGPDTIKYGREFPIYDGHYKIDVHRKVTKKDIENYPIRWEGYEEGQLTNAFDSAEDALEYALDLIKVRFKGNWKVKIVDYTGNEDLEKEIHVSDL